MAKKDEKKSKSESKTPELTKAKKALDAYLKENKLDPTKDWTKDKKHGKKVTELVNKLNKERDKVAAAYPEASFLCSIRYFFFSAEVISLPSMRG